MCEAGDENSGITYSDHLQLPKLLSCQCLLSTVAGDTIPEEHMFIITHQTYELWFKQVIYDLDNLIQLVITKPFQAKNSLQILERIDRIFKLLIQQMEILETMNAQDFMNFRCYLKSASGYQSFQFRIIENRLGVLEGKRIKYNEQDYKQFFKDNQPMAFSKIEHARREKSLFDAVEEWLASLAKDYASHWLKYSDGVLAYIKDLDEPEKTKLKATFSAVLDEKKHNELMKTGDRRFSYKSYTTALSITVFPEVHEINYLIVQKLVDIDTQLAKWRHNHVLLAQKMLGGKSGTGGSSGYSYLRSTVSDRYKVFLDITNMSSFVIPEKYLKD